MSLKTRIQRALPWVPLVLVSAFYIFELLPEKGVSLQDESWFLYSAWAMAAPGIALDTHNVHVTAFVLNGILMFLGFEDYYSLRVMLHVFILFSFFIYFYGVYSGKGDLPKILPLLAPIALFGGYHTLINHKNAPIPLMMIAIGTFYHYLNSDKKRLRLALLAVSAICLGLSGFVNLTVFPAALLACGFLLFSNREKGHNWIYGFVCLLSLAGPLVWYVLSVGIEDFSGGTADHSISKAVGKITSVLTFEFHWLAVFGLLFFLGGFAEKKKFILKFDKLKIGLVLMFATVSFYTFLLTGMSIYSLNIVDQLGIQWIKGFDIDWHLKSWELHIQDVPGSLSFALIWLALLSCCRGKDLHKRLLMFTVLLFVYFSGQAAASNSLPQRIAVFYSGPLLAVSILFFYDFLKDSNLPGKSLEWKLFTVSVGMIFFLGFIYQTNYSFFTRQHWVYKEPVRVNKLYGLRETPLKKAALEKMVRIYEEQGCAEKEFIAMVNSPLPYYLFERRSTGKGSWIQQNRDFYSQLEKIYKAIHSPEGSCVYLSREFEMPEKWHDFSGAQRMKEFLDSNSDLKINIGRYPDPFGTFWVYVFSPKDDV